jgi:hypothetical protein
MQIAWPALERTTFRIGLNLSQISLAEVIFDVGVWAFSLNTTLERLRNTSNTTLDTPGRMKHTQALNMGSNHPVC